ncbi:MAG: hypothetical protein LBD96_07975 [Treponema sp.]|jgi:hypothetical protein|nr:hypothetical protein [Treponema sp.]
MKKVGFMFVVVAVVVMAGCTSVDHTTSRVGWSSYADIAVKNFEAVGVVFLESQEVFEYGPFGLSKSLKGSRIVWSDILAEAVNMGGDDIINVRIETTNQTERVKFIDFFTGYTLTYKYKATALAIKYTEAVEREKSGMGTSINLNSNGPEREFRAERGLFGATSE